MGIDRHEEHINDVSARPIVGGVLLTFIATRRQNACTDSTPRLKHAEVFLPWPQVESIHAALTDDADYHHTADGVSIDVTGPPDGDSAGWFIVRYGEAGIEVDMTRRSARQVHKTLGQALARPRPHPFIRMYEHSELHDGKGRVRQLGE